MTWVMPIIFTLSLLQYPAGLSLYIFTNNLLSIGQQYGLRKWLDQPEVEAAAGVPAAARRRQAQVSEQAQPQQSPSGARPTAGTPERRVEKLLADILGLMGCPARLDFKDAADGGLSVALHFESARCLPGVEVGKRSQVLDSLQFLLNKMLHRPGAGAALGGARRGCPPRAPALASQAPRSRCRRRPRTAPAPARAGCPREGSAAAPAAPAPQGGGPARRPRPRLRARRGDERTVEVSEDAALQEAARQLAGKSGSLGRFYAIAAMKPEDRARVLKAVEGVAGVAGGGRGRGAQPPGGVHSGQARPAAPPKSAAGRRRGRLRGLSGQTTSVARRGMGKAKGSRTSCSARRC